MKAYQIEIFATKDSRATQELSCITKSKSVKECKVLAKQIIDQNKDKYDSIKLQRIFKI